MTVHRFLREQTLAAPITEAWDFISRPRNLDRITPPGMRFRITSEPGPEIFEGEIITYRIRLAPLIWRNWVSEIKAVTPGCSFIDDQRSGPYRFWHHRHELIAIDDKRTRMIDEIHYAVGFGPIGELANSLYVRPMLERIFAYRHEALDRIFNPDSMEPASQEPASAAAKT